MRWGNQSTLTRGRISLILCSVLILSLFSTFNIIEEAEASGFIQVVGDGEGTYPTLQSAIDNASDGDRIIIPQGNIFENVLISKSLTIIGEGIDSTTIFGTDTNAVMRIFSKNLSISNLRISNEYGDGIYTNDVSYLSLQNISFQNCINGLYYYKSDNLSVVGCSYANNQMGLLSERSNVISVTNSEFINNPIKFDDCIDISLLKCRIRNTTSDAGLFSRIKNIEINNCTFIDNFGTSMSFDQSININIEKSNFMNNDGNGIEFYLCNDFTINNSTITDNSRNGLLISYSQEFNIFQNKIIENKYHGIFLIFCNGANIIGNNIFNNFYGIEIKRTQYCIIKDNILENNKIFFHSPYLTTYMEDFISHTFEDNLLNGNNILYIKNKEDVDYSGNYGEIICINSSSVTLRNQQFDTDYSVQIILSDDILLYDSEVKFSKENGIYIVNSEQVRISNITITLNDIGIKIHNSNSISVTNCSFIRNREAIELLSSDAVNISFCDFINNEIGVENNASSTNIIASMNWWGDITGPYHDINNPTGEGDPVFGDVVIHPWLQEKHRNSFPIIIGDDNLLAKEDQYYNNSYSGFDLDDEILVWSMETNSKWLKWNQFTLELVGTPDNTDIGEWWVKIILFDGRNGYAVRNFTITVINAPPTIIGFDIDEVNQNEYYYNDYDSDDDGQGQISWEMRTNSSWITLDSGNGTVSGIPNNEHVGYQWVNLTVNDGNNGSSYRNFTIKIINVNDKPIIYTIPEQSIYEDNTDFKLNLSEYFFDPDNDVLSISFEENENISLRIIGEYLHITPMENWSGNEIIMLLISDNEFSVTTTFNLTVEPVSDPPTIISIDYVNKINIDDVVIFSVSVFDPDILYGDVLNITWESNISGIFQYGEIAVCNLPEGHHNISITVKDQDNNIALGYINIEVFSNNSNVENGENRNILFVLIPILIIFVILIVVMIIIFKRKKLSEKIDDNSIPEATGDTQGNSEHLLYEDKSKDYMSE